MEATVLFELVAEVCFLCCSKLWIRVSRLLVLQWLRISQLTSRSKLSTELCTTETLDIHGNPCEIGIIKNALRCGVQRTEASIRESYVLFSLTGKDGSPRLKRTWPSPVHLLRWHMKQRKSRHLKSLNFLAAKRAAFHSLVSKATN